MMKKKKINLLLVILWMIVIFVMSSFNATESSKQSGIIVDFINNFLHINNITLLSIIIRKIAHFTEYFILGLLVYNLVKDKNKKVIISLVVCILYAISDEIHQIFVSGRSFQITDILIDTYGAFISIILFHIFSLKIDKSS